MELTFPRPTNWQEFENLSLFLWREMWGDPVAQKNGRPGQAQSGVDIYGRPVYASGWHGVQCKGKAGGFNTALTETEIESELTNAKSFEPRLEYMVFATTAARDKNIQEFVRKAPVRLGLDFGASVWSWEDVSLELSYRPNLVERLFPSHAKYLNDPLRIEIPRLDPRNRLGVGFTRPAIREVVASDRIFKLQQVIAEVVDNCFRHGNATTAVVDIRLDGVIIVDDGLRFDPLERIGATTASLSGGIGLALFAEFVREFSVVTVWDGVPDPKHLGATERGNRLTLSWRSPANSPLGITRSEYTVADYAVCARDEAKRAVTQIMRNYQGGHLHLRIDGIVIVSGIAMLIQLLLQALPSHANIYVYALDQGYNRSLLKWGGPRIVFVPIPASV